MLTLGLETSCDETAAAVVEEARLIRSNVIASSSGLLAKYGGVVPEIASRHHVEAIQPVVAEALTQAGVGWSDLGLIAVTHGPGLPGALHVGVAMAKALAFSLDRPLIGVNHLRAHVYANWLSSDPPEFPVVGLIISGGHTNLIYASRVDRWELLGQTRDDAVGEAFDKVAKMVGLGYPGGPVIDRLARDGNRHAIRFPRALLEAGSLDFSFSGLKTAVLLHVRHHGQDGVPDLAASFQEAAVDVVVTKALEACRVRRASRLVIGGGVGANTRFREMMAAEASKQGIRVWMPPRELCVDNAAMIAALGARLFGEGGTSSLELEVNPSGGVRA